MRRAARLVDENRKNSPIIFKNAFYIQEKTSSKTNRTMYLLVKHQISFDKKRTIFFLSVLVRRYIYIIMIKVKVSFAYMYISYECIENNC